MNRTEIHLADDFTGSFAGALLDPDIAVPEGVTGPDREPAPRRYGVYRNNVVTSLMEALAATFPSVRALLGEDNFARIARNHVAFHPPRSPLMQHYGAEFAGFLDSFPPLRKLPWLGDVARLERGFLDAHHAADAQCLCPEMLAGIAPEDVTGLRLEQHPATFLMASPYPVVDLFAWGHERPAEFPDLAKAQSALVTRPALAVEVRAIERVQHDFMAMLAQGIALGEAAGTALEADANFDLAGTLALSIAAGVFRACDGGAA